MVRIASLLALFALLPASQRTLSLPSVQPVPGGHTSSEWKKCKKCSGAYDKALAYLRANLNKMYFPPKMFVGLVLLYDGRYPDDVENVLKTAIADWTIPLKHDQVKHGTNWYPALGATFMLELHRHEPDDRVVAEMPKILEHFQKTQEPTGNWAKWKGQGLQGYPVKDMGFLSGVINGVLWNCKPAKIRVDDGMFQRADKGLQSICGGAGISYGTGQSGPDETGGRGAFTLLGLHNAGNTSHPVYKVYSQLLPRTYPNMNKGHHIGGLHASAVILGCHRLGPAVYSKLTQHWLDRLIDSQNAQGGVYVGDDGADGGEKGLFGEDFASTAALCLMIMGQDPNAFTPKRLLPAKIEIGEKAPLVRAKNQDGASIALKDLVKEKKNILLAFYPKDGKAPGTKILEKLRDTHDKFIAANVTVLGISTDSVESHKKFRTDLKLPFDLLADPDKSLHARFNFRGPATALLLIDGEGVIRFAIKSFSQKPAQWEALFKAVESLKAPPGK